MALGSNLEKRVEVLQADRLRLERARRHGLQLEFDPGDDPGQPQAADRGGEELRALRWSDLEEGAVAPQQPERTDVTPEGAGPIVVLAVDIVGDRPAKGHELGPRRHGHEPAARHADFEQPPDRKPRLRPHDAGRPVGRDDAIEAAHPEQAAAIVEAHVAIGAAEATRQETTRSGFGRMRCQSGQKLVVEGRFTDPALPVNDAAPGGGRDGLDGSKPHHLGGDGQDGAGGSHDDAGGVSGREEDRVVVHQASRGQHPHA